MEGDKGTLELSHQFKALTLQLPNERELKNETRWIYCWNLWTELIRLELDLTLNDSGIDLRLPCRDEDSPDSKEALLTELQAHIITKPAQTLSKVKTVRLIKEMNVKIEVWEKLRSETVNFLASLQILLCENKAGERELNGDVLSALESLNGQFMNNIGVCCKRIDDHYRNLEDVIGRFRKFKCHGLFVDPVVAEAMEKIKRRSNQPTELPGGGRIRLDETAGDLLLNESDQRPEINEPDIPEALIFGKKSAQRPSDFLFVKDSVLYYMKMIQQGSEWYLSWSQFTDTVLGEIKALAPALGSEVMTIMTKHINQQIRILKTLVPQIRSLGGKVKTLESSEDEMSTMITCLSVFDDFVSLIESLKHEASYLIRYVEIALINLGVLDLKKEPKKLTQQRLYLTRNIIVMKDGHLLSSIEYLYKDMGLLIEYIEFRFHMQKDYLEKLGPMSAELLKKYTVHRKDVIQEREMESLQNVEELDLAKELQAVDLHGTTGTSHQQFPLSRYHRAEDVRKWVEEAKKVKDVFPNSDDMQDDDVKRTRGRGIRLLPWKSAVQNQPENDKSVKKIFSLRRKH